MSNITKAEKLKSELDALRPIAKEQEAKIMQKLRLDWDYHSNHLEGNSLSYGETKALILFGITAQGKPLKDHFEITGHDEAVKWVMDIVQGEYPLTESFIRELHLLLLKEPYQVDAITPDGQPTKKTIAVGAYKTTPNHVKTKTGEIFRFAEPEETPALMHDLMDWYNQFSIDVSPVLLAAEFHYKFIRIHPFDDGNGRTARILMNFILMKNGYPPVIIKTEDKEHYYSVLQQADAGIIEPFWEYIAENLCRSLEIMIKGAKGESIEEPDDLDKEIALLEKKVRSKGNKIEIFRTKESVKKIFDESITKLIVSFVEKSSKMSSFYVEHSFLLFVNGSAPNFNNVYDAIAASHEKIDGNLQKVNPTISYKGFNQSGFGEFNYSSSLLIEFGYTNILIKDYANKVLLEMHYGDILTDGEINSIVAYEIKRHKEFIENKLKIK